MPLNFSDDGLLEPTTNVIVMSEAGKPIFARFGQDEEVSRICSLLQAVRTSILYSRGLGLGDIQSLQSEGLTIVFMVAGSLTLVAVSHESLCRETMAYLRLQLEYVYANIIVAFTSSVQTMFDHNPGFDLQNLLSGTTETLMRQVLDESSSSGNPAPFLTSGIETLYPISPNAREKLSRVLQIAGAQTPDTVFALVLVDDKLVTLVQPSFRPHQLHASDLHLFGQFVARQPGLLSSELWLPVCLPRFNASGFMYCYSNCLDAKTRTVLTLVSQNGTTEQFHAFRQAAAEIRRELGLKGTSSTGVLEIIHSYENSGAANEVQWRRMEESYSDEDYVDASGDGTGIIPYVPNEDFTLVKEIETANSTREALLQQYLELAGAIHFVFRLDVRIHHTGGRSSKSQGGRLSQTIAAPLGFPFIDDDSRRRVWTTYQRLNLRLRLSGSASIESTMDAFDMVSEDSNDGAVAPGVGRHCPSIGLAESSPNMQGVAFLIEGTETFLAMNGREFEL